MAYTAPTTRITGDVITSGHWNTDLTSNIAWLATDKPMCRAYKAASQNLNNLSETALTFDTESFDNATLHDNSTNPTRMTFATAGRYLLGGSTVAASSASAYSTQIMVKENATSYVSRSMHGNTTSAYPYLSIATFWSFAANEYAELFGWHDRGSATAFGEAGADSEPQNFWAVWIGTA